MYQAFDFKTGRLWGENEKPNDLVIEAWQSQYRLWRDWAIKQCKEGGPHKSPKFIIKLERPIWHDEKITCLALCAGYFELCHIAFPEIKFTDALTILNAAKNEIKKAA